MKLLLLILLFPVYVFASENCLHADGTPDYAANNGWCHFILTSNVERDNAWYLANRPKVIIINDHEYDTGEVYADNMGTIRINGIEVQSPMGDPALFQ